MKTNEAVSPVPADVIIFSMVGLFVFYTLLIIADLFLLRKYAIKGPSDETAATKEHKIAS
jgi:cytochrome d ubiquinol oxidase subunit I